MKQGLLSLILGLLFAAPAVADTIANPSLWHVKDNHGEAWLFGSMHMLPPGIDWQTRAIARAMAAADTFVFEVPNDAATKTRITDLVASHGMLPPGQTLPALLSPEARAEYETAIAEAHLSQAATDHERPWLVDLQLLMSQTQRLHFAADDGVDSKVMARARTEHKAMRYFETIEDQFKLLAPDDDKLEFEEFESDLKTMKGQEKDLAPIVAAWQKGDTAAIDRLMNGELAAFPDAKKALLTDRNARWLTQIKAMLGEKHRFFITVGAAHLAGPEGVPALLRKAGYKVEGP